MPLRRLRALCHYGFPFAVAPPTTPVERWRALGFPARFSSHGRLKQFVGHALMTAGWPAGAFLDSLRYARMMAAEPGGPKLFTLWRDMYRLALTRNIPPLEYRLYRFSDADRRRDAGEYIYWNDLPALTMLNACNGANNEDVQDKLRFAQICARFGLPHVPTLAVFAGGRQLTPERPFVPEAERLFVKNYRAKGGLYAERWTRESGGYRNTQNQLVPAQRLAETLRRVDCIVQPCLDNHPLLAERTNGALASLRIVTGIDRSGTTEFLGSLLTLPSGQANTSAGGIICRLASDTGIITRAHQLRAGRDLTGHPDTGAPLIGVVLPFWHESVALAKHAHAIAFPRFVFLGWDIALTPAGAVLLETNSGWGALFHQMMDGPLGRTALSRLLDGYLSVDKER